MAESKLTSALIAALGDPNSAGDRIRDVSKEEIQTAGEAELIVRLLKLFPSPPNTSSKRPVGSPLRDVLALMQKTEDKEAIALLRELGGPELLRIFDETLQVATPDNMLHAKNDLLFLLKIVCKFAPKGGLERVVTAVRSPLLKDGYLWSVIFQIVSNNRHPWQTDIVEALRDPLPDGFSAVAYLDLSNAVARSGKLARHPFDTEAGLALLQGWLVDKDEERSSYGHSAAASIPFLSPWAREKVQALADQHPDRAVQLEAAWAAAACGESRGYERLQAACAAPQEAAAAMHYLTELGAEDRIPLHARSDNFKAISEMCQWLAHPMELGSPPHEIRQVDTRELFWPPTNDHRKLWVFRYEYPPRDGKAEPEIGHGMVGSVTFALFGEATPDLSAEQVYGLHCAWELEMKRDARAPQKRTVEAGIQILREYNPGFAKPD
jgi:hypothetical protein